ncbi:MAG: hypothetical protein R8M38_04365 [Mariprofundaceae bacterium]
MFSLVNRMTKVFFSLSLAFVALLMTFAFVADAAEVEVHGFLLGTASSRVNNQPLKTGEKNNWLLGEERLRLELSSESDEGDIATVSKFDVIADNVSGKAALNIRELYAEYIADSYEVRVGRQMLTWGVADRLFINDVFPKDWSAFFSGKSLEYMKVGSDMAKISVFGGSWDVELALIPIAQVDVVPTSERYIVFDPGFTTKKPDDRFENAEAALRLHTTVGTTDIAVYAFRGFWHQPDKGVLGRSIIYPKLNTYGLTVQDSVLGGVLSFETGFYQSADDSKGTNPLIANSQTRYLLGYEHDIATDITLGVQVYGEVMHQHAAYFNAAQAAFNVGLGPSPQPKYRQIMTANLRALWLNQTLTTSVFSMMVGNGGGRMVNPDVHYAMTDELSVNMGGHVFWGGPDSWMLGMMKHDDNVYMNGKWSF